ncbi:hypothetical protein K493DRAFT_130729, partial [Basidiobolus meristosporus CBS 931.73]
NGASIHIVTDQKPRYKVYGGDFWGKSGCGTVMSDSKGALVQTVQDYNYKPQPSIHGTAFTPDSRILYSADMSNNSFWMHPLDRKTDHV